MDKSTVEQHEQRFGYLLKAKTKALSVFQKAHQSLLTAITTIEDELESCLSRANEHDQYAHSEREAADYLAQEAKKNRETAEKLGDILGVK